MKFFNLKLIRKAGNINLSGDLSSLRSGRAFLQSLRIAGKRPLRVHTNDANIRNKMSTFHETRHFLSYISEDAEFENIFELINQQIIDVAVINLDSRLPKPPEKAVYLPVESYRGNTRIFMNVCSHPQVYGCESFRALMDAISQL